MRTFLPVFQHITWLIVAGLALLGSCQPASQSAGSCPPRPHLALVPRDTFDLLPQLERQPVGTISDGFRLPFAHQQRWLQGAYVIGSMLQDSVTPSPYGGGAFYYGLVRQLVRSPRASCHQVIYAEADEFTGFFLVIGYPSRPACLYLSGCLGSAYEDAQRHYEWEATRSVVLNDSTVLVKTGRSAYAFRRSRQRSYTDTISRRYRIDYRASRFVLLRRDSARTYLPGEYFD